MTIRQGVNYGPAEARGQLRQWKKKLAKDYAVLDGAITSLQSRSGMMVACDMVKSAKTGRKRAFESINKMLGPGATLETVNLGRNSKSLAVWSILKPRDSVMVVTDDRSFSHGERESLSQDCVTVNYVLIGRQEMFVCEGLWTLEVPDHALGRAVERSGFLHPGALIREAHLTLLNLPNAVLQDSNVLDTQSSGIYVKAGNGCFAGHLFVATDVSQAGRHSAHFRVKTWLDQNQLSERQIIKSEKGEPGQTWGDGILKPTPLRRIVVSGNKLEVYTR